MQTLVGPIVTAETSNQFIKSHKVYTVGTDTQALAVSIQIYSGIARFPCDSSHSTAFLLMLIMVINKATYQQTEAKRYLIVGIK